jgi:hypothetical protein
MSALNYPQFWLFTIGIENIGRIVRITTRNKSNDATGIFVNSWAEEESHSIFSLRLQ